ncbi:MAG: serine hydrolase [bacterium]|nr:serine hydrolase [bacterium]
MNFRRHLIIALIVASISMPLMAATNPGASIDSICAPYSASGSPGCVIAVVKDGKTIFAKGYGLADLDNDVPMTVNSVLDIGSNTKQFTVTSILLLEEQGKLSLDDDLRKHIPEFPQYPWKITLRHLAQHTSGIRDYFDLLTLKGMGIGNNYPDEEYFKLIYSQSELNFPPGEQHMYSNSGFILLAEVVRRVSGMPMAQFAQENILDALGMKNAVFFDDPYRIVKHRTSSYGPFPDGGYWSGASIATNIGDGGILSDVGDLAIWDANFYENKLGKKDPNLMRKLETRTVLNNGDTMVWALGLRHDENNGHHVIRHGGAYFGFRSEIARFPEQHLTVIVLANLATIEATGLAYQVADLYLPRALPKELADTSPAKFVTLSRPALEAKAGAFRNPNTGTIWTITPNDTALSVATSTGFNFDLMPISDNEFLPTGIALQGTVAYQKLPSGELTIELAIAGQQTARFQPFRVDTMPPNLDQYVGEYRCRELELTFVLSLEGDVLRFAEKGTTGQIPAQPTIKDEFVAQGGQTQIRFERDENDRIHAMRLSLPRAKNILFERASS